MNSNFLLTLSHIPYEGFKTQLHILSNTTTRIEHIESLESAAILIPYNYKNTIEQDCFTKTNQNETPIILAIENTLHSKKEIDAALKLLHKPLHQNISISTNTLQKVSKEQYIQHFQTIQNYLKNGDIYEINYCIPFVFENLEVDFLDLFNYLSEKMKAPYTALMKYEDNYILCFSPERFLIKNNDKLTTEPIKGTAKRHINDADDKQSKEELLHSLKEKTENAMIVDVARNDLSKIAVKGSVTVEKLYDIKSYETVHQMVSTISCKIKPDTSFKDIIHATFPMASMTGAPKIRAMQIAEELESEQRNFYSGCIGYYNKGNFDLAVLIRSIFYDSHNKALKIWVGSAVTIYAEAEKEYEECLLKAEKLIEGVLSVAKTTSIV